MKEETAAEEKKLKMFTGTDRIRITELQITDITCVVVLFCAMTRHAECSLGQA